MADGQDVKEFPNVNQKLAAPKKLSAFERERQAAEAKRQRAEAEDAAALKAFQESFAGDGDDDDEEDFGGRTGTHFAERGADGRSNNRSGPGSLGPAPPPSGLKRKRALDEARAAELARRDPSVRHTPSFADNRRYTDSVDRNEDLDQEVPKPTVQLSDLPPWTTERDVEEILHSHVNVHSVQLLPGSEEGARSSRAVVALSSDVSMSDIDNAISALRGRYLGFGHELNITRHLSSAASFPDVSARGLHTSIHPYGASKPPDRHASLRNAPPPTEYHAFAPPESYDARSSSEAVPPFVEAVVEVRPPQDISLVRAIHTLASRLLSEPDPERALELEAMLMAQPIVQLDERFAFLFDATSPAGVYYRHLLWTAEGEATPYQRDHRLQCVDNGYPISWASPRKETPFPDLTTLSEAIDHENYVSSDEESEDDEGGRRFNDGREGEKPLASREKRHLRPLPQARLVHLLSRLPKTSARLRTGDIARVTHFAMVHASHAAEEIVDILLLNVIRPFSWSSANGNDSSDEDAAADFAEARHPLEEEQEHRDSRRDDDPSNASLIALFAISDILSASSTAGARNAWKYRQLFETGFKAQRTFYRLGRLDKDRRWGKMKAEHWKRKIGVLLGLWESWNMFSIEIHEELKHSFFEPETSWRERAAEQAEQQAKKSSSRAAHQFEPIRKNVPEQSDEPSANGEHAEDIEGEPMDDDIDGEPLMDDIDGQPMDDADRDSVQDTVDEHMRAGAHGGSHPSPDDRSDQRGQMADSVTEKEASPRVEHAVPKRRMRAEDMFADSDEE